jgi:hypothetical protein
MRLSSDSQRRRTSLTRTSLTVDGGIDGVGSERALRLRFLKPRIVDLPESAGTRNTTAIYEMIAIGIATKKAMTASKRVTRKLKPK